MRVSSGHCPNVRASIALPPSRFTFWVTCGVTCSLAVSIQALVCRKPCQPLPCGVGRDSVSTGPAASATLRRAARFLVDVTRKRPGGSWRDEIQHYMKTKAITYRSTGLRTRKARTAALVTPAKSVSSGSKGWPRWCHQALPRERLYLGSRK